MRGERVRGKEVRGEREIPRWVGNLMKTLKILERVKKDLLKKSLRGNSLRGKSPMIPKP